MNPSSLIENCRGREVLLSKSFAVMYLPSPFEDLHSAIGAIEVNLKRPNFSNLFLRPQAARRLGVIGQRALLVT